MNSGPTDRQQSILRISTLAAQHLFRLDPEERQETVELLMEDDGPNLQAATNPQQAEARLEGWLDSRIILEQTREAEADLYRLPAEDRPEAAFGLIQRLKADPDL